MKNNQSCISPEKSRTVSCAGLQPTDSSQRSLYSEVHHINRSPSQKAAHTAAFVRVRTKLDRLINMAIEPLFSLSDSVVKYHVAESGSFDGEVRRWLVEGDLTVEKRHWPREQLLSHYQRGATLLSLRVENDKATFELYVSKDVPATSSQLFAVAQMLSYIWQHLDVVHRMFPNDQRSALKCVEEWLKSDMVTMMLTECASHSVSDAINAAPEHQGPAGIEFKKWVSE
jgi:hypothetical protein